MVFVIHLAVYITGYVASGLSAVALGISLYKYIKEKQRHQLFMVFTWIFLLLWSVLATTSHIFLSIEMHKLAFICIMPMTFAIILLSDSISRESVDIRKIGFACFFSGMMVVFSLRTDAVVFNVWPTGEVTLMVSGFYSLSFAILGVFMGILLVYYTAKVLMNAPKSMKKIATYSFTGAILAGIVMPIFSATGVIHVLIGADFLLLTGGAFIMSISFIKEPRLAYILPFKAHRLMVLHTGASIPIFIHTWDKEFRTTDGQLFSGMVQGVSMLLEESAILILEHSQVYPIICVLIATKASRILRTALDGFAEKFFSRYSDKFKKPNYTSQFSDATTLIDEFFPFIPEYD
ncbi:MAG: hypothetical protein ACTSRW_17800 [Candidatus Helarchaeota archaeon]